MEFLYIVLALLFIVCSYIVMNECYGIVGGTWCVLVLGYMIFFCPALGATWAGFFFLIGLIMLIPHILVVCVSMAFIKQLFS